MHGYATFGQTHFCVYVSFENPQYGSCSVIWPATAFHIFPHLSTTSATVPCRGTSRSGGSATDFRAGANAKLSNFAEGMSWTWSHPFVRFQEQLDSYDLANGRKHRSHMKKNKKRRFNIKTRPVLQVLDWGKVVNPIINLQFGWFIWVCLKIVYP